jgi:hypothetical protein
MGDLVRSGENFAKPQLCKVGTCASAFFEDTARVFGGDYAT